MYEALVFATSSGSKSFGQRLSQLIIDTLRFENYTKKYKYLFSRFKTFLILKNTQKLKF